MVGWQSEACPRYLTRCSARPRRHGAKSAFAYPSHDGVGLFGSYAARTVRRDLEGKMEDRQVLARMVLVAGQFRQAEIDGPGFLALVDGRVEIDEMPAGVA